MTFTGYPPEIKNKAKQMWQKNRPKSEIEAELGLGKNTLWRWRQQWEDKIVGEIGTLSFGNEAYNIKVIKKLPDGYKIKIL